jgi:thiol-disulfide isomerase/thioredoxin
MRDYAIWIIGALIAISIGLAVVISPADDGPKLAPDFTLENLDGESVALASLAGRVVVLDFWATWCKPCVTTFPGLHEFVGEYEADDVALLVVSLDRVEKRARDYLVENGFPTDNVLWSSMEESREVKALYGVVGIPHTFIIDRDGIIRFSGHPARLSGADIEPWL